MTTESYFRSAETGIVTTLQEWDKIYPDWASMLEKQPRLPVSVDPRWLFYWWKHFGANKELCIFWSAMGGDVLVILPMMIKTIEGKRVLSFLSDCCSDYLGGIFSFLAYDPVERIVAIICQELEWDEMELQNIRQDDDTLHMLMRALQSLGLSPTAHKCSDAPYIRLDGTWENYLASRSRNRRKVLNKKTRQLHAAGKLEFRVLKEYDNKVIEQAFAIHDYRWEKMHSVQAFADSRRKSFVHEVAEDFARTGNLCLFQLQLDGRLIAYRMGFIRGKVYYDWNTSFDMAFTDYSPGMVLVGDTIRWAFDNNLAEIDFMRGYEEYKLFWNTGVRSLYTIRCCRSRGAFRVKRPSKSTAVLNALANKNGVVLDLDGVVYRGNEPIDPTIKGIRLLREKGISIGFLTNTSSKSQEEIREKLESMGIAIEPFHIMTSSVATAAYCREMGYRNCLVIGGASALPEALLASGCKIITEQASDFADVLVVGYTKEFSYNNLLHAQSTLLYGASFVCTDRDPVFATSEMPKPGTGWIVSAIETVTGVSPFVVGKPNDFSLQLLLRLMGLKPNEVAVIGDSLDTDIAAAKKAGSLACLLLGGISTNEDAARRTNVARPDLVFSEFTELVEIVQGGQS